MKTKNKIISIFLILFLSILSINAVTNYDFQNNTIPGVFSFPATNDKNWGLTKTLGNTYLKSLNIGNNQKSTIMLNNVKVGTGNISFDYYTSSELNYDFMNFYINNKLILSDSGVQISFKNYKYPISNGIYTFKWEYIKDSGISNGKDEVYLDNIVFQDYINSTNINDNLIKSNFIIDYSPKNLTSINNYFNFDISLNRSADCQLYINNNLETSFKDLTSFSYEKLFGKQGEIKYYWYCKSIFNKTNYYQKTNIETLNINFGSNNVNFVLYDQLDNLIYGDNLYLVTPCLKEYINIYQTKLNQNEPKYFQKLTNGIANFNLDYTNKYNFCLVRGQINYKDDGFSKNFDLVKINKQLELGDLYVKNNTYNYVFRVDSQDLKNVFEPDFWGKTWADLFNLIISLIVGGLIITLGVVIKSDKVVLGGVIVLIAGMGVSTLNLVGGILF